MLPILPLPDDNRFLVFFPHKEYWEIGHYILILYSFFPQIAATTSAMTNPGTESSLIDIAFHPMKPDFMIFLTYCLFLHDVTIRNYACFILRHFLGHGSDLTRDSHCFFQKPNPQTLEDLRQQIFHADSAETLYNAFFPPPDSPPVAAPAAAATTMAVEIDLDQIPCSCRVSESSHQPRLLWTYGIFAQKSFMNLIIPILCSILPLHFITNSQ